MSETDETEGAVVPLDLAVDVVILLGVTEAKDKGIVPPFLSKLRGSSYGEDPTTAWEST